LIDSPDDIFITYNGVYYLFDTDYFSEFGKEVVEEPVKEPEYVA